MTSLSQTWSYSSDPDFLVTGLILVFLTFLWSRVKLVQGYVDIYTCSAYDKPGGLLHNFQLTISYKQIKTLKQDPRQSELPSDIGCTFNKL